MLYVLVCINIAMLTLSAELAFHYTGGRLTPWDSCTALNSLLKCSYQKNDECDSIKRLFMLVGRACSSIILVSPYCLRVWHSSLRCSSATHTLPRQLGLVRVADAVLQNQVTTVVFDNLCPAKNTEIVTTLLLERKTFQARSFLKCLSLLQQIILH